MLNHILITIRTRLDILRWQIWTICETLRGIKRDAYGFRIED